LIPEVVVIDDTPATADALCALLSAAGFRCRAFYRAGDAMTYIQTHGCAAAIVDIHLPDMNGLVLSHKLRHQLGARTPIVVLSGDTSMATLNSLSHVGATHFFSKPVNATVMLEHLAGWIDEARRTGSEPVGHQDGGDDDAAGRTSSSRV
jgi:FixJ family two-component response regulator